MSHVDKGRLHAWLDFGRSDLTEAEYTQIGSHLARCAECSAMLAEERALRERASAILGGAGPRVSAAPSFDELVARAGRVDAEAGSGTSASGAAGAAGAAGAGNGGGLSETGPIRPPARRPVERSRPLVGLAWAASVMAALGLGWAASTLLDRDQIAIQTDTVERRSVADRASPSAAPPPGIYMEGQEAASAAAGGAGPGADQSAAASAAVSGADAGPESAAAKAAAAEDTRSGATGQVPIDREELAVVGYGSQARPAVTSRGAAVETDQLQDARIDGRDATGGTPPAPADPDAGARAPVSDGPVAAAAAARSAQEAAEPQAAPPPAPPAPPPPPQPLAASRAGANAVTYATEAALIWTIVSREEAERRLGSPLFVHAELPLLRIETPTSAQVQAARTIYTLPDGSNLTVTLVRAQEGEATPAATERAAVARRGDVILTGTGLIGVDSIARLLEEIR